jgi:sulfite dehydrogenase
LLHSAGLSLLAGGSARAAGAVGDPALPAGLRESAVLEAPAGKNKLIKLTWRPPNYETPLAGFQTPITANADFFVRYHVANLPTAASLKNWSLKVGGEAAGRTLSFSLAELKAKFAHTEVTAVCQCSGNRRGLSDPHVPGVQWGVGAMGNARWTGVRLRDVLAAAGVAPAALEVGFDGADAAVLPGTPDFIKSIPLARAMDETTLIAWGMNGRDLPLANGYPARIIVPGWTATYWMKHVTSIDIRTKPSDSFWMQKAYRVPKGLFPGATAFPSQDDAAGHAVTEIVVNSLITAPLADSRLGRVGFEVKGIAWDGGSGIRGVEVSIDGGRSWAAATLGRDLGRFAFRAFSLRVAKAAPGPGSILARATAMSGQTQAERLVFNPAGYHNNVPRPIAVTVV